jgi:Novel STAND NTPase 1
MNAVKTPWRQSMPDFLQLLDGTLGHKVKLHKEVLGYDVYLVDLSDWKLRFSDRTPLILVKEADLASMSPRELAQSLSDMVRAQSLAERNPIVLVEGPAGELKAQLHATYQPLLVLDQADVGAVRESRRPSGELLDRLAPQLDLSLLAPYETSKPVTGSRFFGREFEVRRILQTSDSNFAIMGIRRIGKTSLMREIERQLKEQAQEAEIDETAERILFMDCSAISSPNNFIQEVVRKLRPQELTRLSSKQFPIFFPDFLERMAQRYGGPIIFFLDEFDKVLTWHYEDDSLLNALRASSNQGHSRYIVGGFREVMRAFSDLESPLYNFARPIRLKEFSREQAAAMILGPLEKLGVHFERRNDVVNRIFDETAGQPNLIQFYCSILVERLDRESSRQGSARSISPESLFDVYGNDDFRAFVLSTFMDNTTHLEKAIVFAVMADLGAEHPFGVQQIDGALERRGVEIPLSDLDLACRNLELAGTFTSRGPLFRFATPVFPRMLSENYDVDYLFRKVLQEGI